MFHLVYQYIPLFFCLFIERNLADVHQMLLLFASGQWGICWFPMCTSQYCFSVYNVHVKPL